VSGFFQPRESVWQEPIYRDVWGLLREFGDAQLAGLIAPRALVIEAARFPAVNGPPPETSDRRGAAPVGRLVTPPLGSVQQELERACPFFARTKAERKLKLVASDRGSGLRGSEQALAAFLSSLAEWRSLRPSASAPLDRRGD
jgi:hypothetical protein